MRNPLSALSSPDWFLERFHIETGTFTFIHTTRARLHETAFHDGRSNLKVTPDIIHVKMDEVLRWHDEQTTRHPHNLIVHTSFCGSTLLARAIDVPQHVLSFREPQVLIDMANLKATGHAAYKDKNVWSKVLLFVFGQFQKRWLPSQNPVIKPSNWANTLLPDIGNLIRPTQYVLVFMRLDAYLVANLRGGKDRLKFSLDLLNHLLVGKPNYQRHAKAIQIRNFTPLQQTLCMLALCHAIQLQIFKALDEHVPGTCLWLSKRDLIAMPEKTISDAANHFELKIPSPELKANVTVSLQNHSKTDGGEHFDRASERNMNAKLRHAYAEDLTLAKSWFDTTFPNLARHAHQDAGLTG